MSIATTGTGGGDGSFWTAVGTQARNVLHGAGVTRSFPAGAVLYREGSPAASALIVLRGAVRVVTTDSDGHERLLAVRGPGDVIGEVSSVWRKPRSATVLCASAVRVLVLPGPAFEQVLRRFPSAALELLRVSGERRRASDAERAEFTGAPMARRIASVLLRLAAEHRPDGDGCVPLPITQGQLAELASASRSSVARALAALRNDGVLRTGPKQIVLTDLDELAAAVSFDTATPGNSDEQSRSRRPRWYQ